MREDLGHKLIFFKKKSLLLFIGVFSFLNFEARKIHQVPDILIFSRIFFAFTQTYCFWTNEPLSEEQPYDLLSNEEVFLLSFIGLKNKGTIKKN